MSSTVNAILPEKGPLVPAVGTAPIAANQLIPRGTIVTRNASGNAVSPSSADASGFPALGISKATYDNRTNSAMGGNAGDGDADFDYGVVGFPYVGTAPISGDRLYVVDNQTFSTSDNGGTRGFAGVCSETRTINGVALAFCEFRPSTASAAASIASAFVDVPLKSAVLLSSGALMAAFANGVSTVPGTEATASGEVSSVRWNNDAAPAAIVQTVYVPAPTDPAAPAVVKLLCSKVGATLADATKFTIAAFAIGLGDLHDADVDFGGDSSSVTGDAASKTLQEVALALAATDMPDTACLLTLQIKPKAGTLGTDDICLHSVRVIR